MLRTIFVSILILIGIRYSFKGAFHVLLFYLWIAYFRPDDWIWGSWVRQLNLSFIVGVYVVIATTFAKERLRFGVGQVIMAAFLFHTAFSIVQSPALYPPWVHIWDIWTDFARKVVIGFAMVILVTTEQRLRATLVVIAFSLAFEGAKQGFAQLVLNPGGTNINSSLFLGDNNGVAVGMLMLIPLLAALARTSKWRWERYLERFFIVGVLYRAISTYSRGGFLAAIALGLHTLLRSKRKMRTLVLIAVASAAIFPVMPDTFWQRMGSIQTAAEAEDEKELDVSQAGRLHFWRVATAMAADRPWIGVGFESYNYSYDRYDFRYGEFGEQRSVHSAWFGLLGELGYVGLGLFIALITRAFYTNWKARRNARSRPELANLVAYGTAIEASLVTFAVGGAFVPFQYNEMLWHLLALTIVLGRLVDEKLKQPAGQPAAVQATPVKPIGPMTRPAAITGVSRVLRTPR